MSIRVPALALLAAFAAAFIVTGPTAAAGDESWILETSEFSTVFTRAPYVGNGYIGQRIPAAGMGFVGAQGVNGWPTFSERITTSTASGVYAELPQAEMLVGGYGYMQVIADIPTWTTIDFASPSGTYSAQTASADNVSEYRQSLDVHSGVVTTSGLWTSPGGEQARFSYRVFADRARKHVAVVKLELAPLWSGAATVTSLLDGAGARRLYPVDTGVDLATHTSHVTSASTGLDIPVAESATLVTQDVPVTATAPVNALAAQTAGESVVFQAQAGRTYTFTKYVAVVTGRDSQNAASDAATESQQAASMGLEALDAENVTAWNGVWDTDVLVSGDTRLQQVIHATEYSLFASLRPDSPSSIGPTGLSGEGYAGLVFWDAETWMYPTFLALHPDVARVMVDYRYKTLAAARQNATENGYAGAFFPWTSAYDGVLDTNCYGVVVVNGQLVADSNRSCTQELHLQGDIALAQWQYYEATGDTQWLAQRGWPVLQGIAQYWASKVTPGPNGTYSINNVQPPDENHTGVNNSAYTNAVAALSLELATEAAQIVGETAPSEWEVIAEGLKRTMPFDATNNVYLEYEGYNGETIKQADVVMLTYPLEFPMPASVARNDVDYYVPRTSLGGPAMTDAIHSIDTSAVNVPGCAAYTYMLRSYTPFLREPFLQLSETRGDTIAGVPVAAFDFLTVAGGFMQNFLYGYPGFRLRPDRIDLDPSLSPQLDGITLKNLSWQGRKFTVTIGPSETTVSLSSGAALPVSTPTGDRLVQPGGSISIPTRRPDLQPTDNVARCRSVSATSAVAGNEPVAAVDGSPVTTWIPTAAQATLTVDLGQTRSLRAVTVKRGSTGQFAYSVDASSDGQQWTTIGSAPAASSGTDEITVIPTDARFLRLSFPGGGSAPVPNIAELSVSASSPTAVTVRSFRARRQGRAVLVSWRTGSETGLLGFNVYRDGRKLNRTLIGAKGATAGAAYRFTDPSVRRSRAHRYRLQLVGPGGKRSWYGSAVTAR